MNKGQHWINPQPWLSRVFWATTWKKSKTHQIASPRIWVNMLNINVRKHAWTIGGFVFRASALQHAPGPAPCFTVGLPGGSGSPVLLQLQRLWLPFPSHPAGRRWNRKGLGWSTVAKIQNLFTASVQKKHETNIYFFCLSNKGGSIFGRCLNSTREYINCEIYQVFFLSKVCISWMISSFLGIIRCVLEMHITYPWIPNICF